MKKIREDNGTPRSWEDLAKIFDSLRLGGFEYARLQKRFFELGYYKPNTKEKRYLSDAIAWFLRPTRPLPQGRHVEGRFLLWQHFREVMQEGGVKAGSNVPLDRTYEEVKRKMRKRKRDPPLQGQC